MWLLVEFVSPSVALTSHGDTNCEYESVSSHKDVPNVFFKDVYFLRVGACGSLFIGTLSFCNGCQTYSCLSEESYSLFALFPRYVNHFSTQSKQGRLFSLYSFFCCFVVNVFCVKENVMYVEMRQIIVVRLSVY